MKTFKEFCEGYEELPTDKMYDKVKDIHGKFDKLVKGKNPGDLFKASQMVNRVGKIRRAIIPQTD